MVITFNELLFCFYFILPTANWHNWNYVENKKQSIDKLMRYNKSITLMISSCTCHELKHILLSTEFIVCCCCVGKKEKIMNYL